MSEFLVPPPESREALRQLRQCETISQGWHVICDIAERHCVNPRRLRFHDPEVTRVFFGLKNLEDQDNG